MGFYNGSNGVLYGYGHLRGFGSLVIHTYTHTYIYIYRKRESLEFCLWIRVENPYLVASVQYSLGAS